MMVGRKPRRCGSKRPSFCIAESDCAVLAFFVRIHKRCGKTPWLKPISLRRIRPAHNAFA